MARLRIGIVGFGGAGIAQYQHFVDLGCHVVSVFDPKPAAHERARKISSTLKTTSDFDQFLNSGLDAVSVCSPDRTHAEYYSRSLLSGKHTISEKPLSDSLEGCRTILAAVKASPNCIAAVQHQMRFIPLYAKMKEIVCRGELGPIAYLEGYYIHNLTTRASQFDMWRFEDHATPLIYSGCHFVDLLRWILEDEVVEVSGMANNLAFPDYPESDTNITLLRFRSGILAKVITAFGFGRPQDHSVRIYGREKCIDNNVLFTKAGQFSIFARPDLSQHTPSSGFFARLRQLRSQYKTLGLSYVFEKLMRTRHISPDYSVASFPMRMYPHALAVRKSLKNFIDAIERRGSLLCSVADAAKTVATCVAGVEAIRTGKTIQVSDYLTALESGQ